ncbi:MAG TPA: ankyrin repeat domain-containing protein [Steroidobacteraceae bacterium]|nr:ankyrin repeat domain-containing protein [Steroidobacteraceae bacterium]
MAQALPARPNLDWLRKTAKDHLRELRAQDPQRKLAEAQFAVARQFGFSSWRALKTHVDQLHPQSQTLADEEVAVFLRHVGAGHIDAVKAALAKSPAIVNAVGPHPYWGGRPQALHVSIETTRRDVFDLLLSAGADVNGDNRLYEHWSPLMITYDKERPDMRETLLARGARIGVVEALMAGDDAAVTRMLQRGKSALPPGPNGGSILAFARTPFAIDRLLELGAPFDIKDRWETTPMEAYSRLGPRGQHLVEHLRSRGVAAPAEVHARVGDKDTLARMLAADPQLIRNDEIILAAVDFGHRELVQWLLDRGANPNARSRIGSEGTALHSAAFEGNLEMVKLLVAAGADIHAIDREHQGTPEGWARAAIEITNNPQCAVVADYLREVLTSGPVPPTRGEPPPTTA